MGKVVIEERINWSWSDKDFVLKKSKSRCSHCGKILDRTTMTMDHYIPISKGGSNDLSNIIPLCHDCNQEKSNKIVYPFDYYRYLDVQDTLDLMVIKDRYINTVKWYNTNNFMREDSVLIRYTSRHNLFGSYRRGHYAKGVPLSVKLEKAVYNDLDDIYKKTIKYNEKYGVPTEHLWETISDIYTKGAIYKIVKGSDIVGIIPIAIRQIIKGKRTVHHYCIEGLPCFYQKPENQDMVYECLSKLVTEVGLIHPCRVAIVNISFPKSDMFLTEMIRSRGNFHPTPSYDEFYNIEFYGIMADKDDVGEDTYKEWQRREDEIKDQYSNFIRKAFELKRCNSKTNADGKRKKSKKYKPRREFDEYDLGYYKSC